MTALKTADAERFLKSPEGREKVVLFFGPDPGGVTDRAAMLAKKLVGDDAMAVIRIDADELSGDPGRIADEAYGGSLFSGRRVVRVRAVGGRNVAPALAPILERPPEDNFVIVEAGDLRKTAPLRKLFEGARTGLAIACYPDTEATIGRMIDEEMRALGIAIEPDARAAVIDLLGTDRGSTRSEISKLALYALDAGKLGMADVIALVGDAAAIAADDVAEAVASGDVAGVDRGARRLLADGTGAQTIGLAVERHFLTLHRLSATAERSSVSDVLNAYRPPLFPQRRAALERQLRLWPREELDQAVADIARMIHTSRTLPAVATGTILQTLAQLSRRVARRSRTATDRS
jgi:DNA polymerase-3 subunit delta